MNDRGTTNFLLLLILIAVVGLPPFSVMFWFAVGIGATMVICRIVEVVAGAIYRCIPKKRAFLLWECFVLAVLVGFPVTAALVSLAGGLRQMILG